MIIECLIKRKNGSNSHMDGIHYHFGPNESDAHVCEVENKKHIARFLSIPTYAVYGDEPIPKDVIKMIASPITEYTVEKQEEIKPTETPIEQWTAAELFEFAKDKMGVDNPQDKDELELYALELYKIQIDKKKSPATIIRGIIKAQRG